MTLDRLRPLANRGLEPFVNLSVKLGVTPNTVSVIALLFAFGGGAAIAYGPERSILYLVGAVLVFLNGWLDLLDGALARRLETDSPAGDLLDHALDRYADIALIVGLTAAIDRWIFGLAAITGVLMTSYLGTQAEAVGLDRVYGGLLGRADRLALIGIAAGLSALVSAAPLGLTIVGWTLVIFAAVGHLTALQRFYYSFRALS
jgi:archaetidylinositol phosphate synthase